MIHELRGRAANDPIRLLFAPGEHLANLPWAAAGIATAYKLIGGRGPSYRASVTEPADLSLGASVPDKVTRTNGAHMRELDQVQMNRLIHTKALFQRAIRISYEAHPLDAHALLLFHDCVEDLLHQASGVLGVELQKTATFDTYWKAAQDQKDITLPGRGAMRRMNEARVAFKHHGIVPSTSTIEQVRADVTTFLTDTVPMVFGIDLDQISMDLLIEDAYVRQLLAEADDMAAKGTTDAITVAVLYLSDAFQLLFNPFIKPELSNADWPALRRASEGAAWQPLLHVVEVERFVQQYYWPVFLLGLDYRDYSAFVAIAPRHHGGTRWPGTRTESHTRLWFEPMFMTKTNYEFCRGFVVRAAIRAEELGGSVYQAVYSGETAQATLKELLSRTDRERRFAIREWARQRGIKVSNHGRIPQDIVDLYDAEVTRAQARTTPDAHRHGMT